MRNRIGVILLRLSVVGLICLAIWRSQAADVRVGQARADTASYGRTAIAAMATGFDGNASEANAATTSPLSNLRVSKALREGRITAGQWVVYRISYENLGAESASDVIITDTLPSGMSFSWWDQPATADPASWTVTVDENVVAFTRSTLAAGVQSYVDLAVAIGVDVGEGTVLTNTVEIGSSSADIDPSDNQAVLSLVVAADRDLSVSKWLASNKLAYGDYATYGIYYWNGGALGAADVVITDTLPVGLSFVSATGAFVPNVVGDKVVWSLGAISGTNGFPYDGYLYLTVHVADTLQPGAVLTNHVQIATSDAESSYANNVGLDIQSVATPTVELSILKWHEGHAAPGSTLKYGISFWNGSNLEAHDTVIMDQMPISTSFVSYSGFYYSPDYTPLTVTPVISGNQVTWPIGTLGAMGQGTIYPVLRLDDTVQPGTTITNTARISTSGSESNYWDNVSMDTQDVVPPTVDLRASKAAYQDARPGVELEYSIYFGNEGDVLAHDVAITDTLPLSTSFISYYGYIWSPEYTPITVTPALVGNQLVWPIGNLVAGTSGYLYVRVRVGADIPVGTIISNTVQIGGSEAEANYQNNFGIDSRQVLTPTIDVSVDKWVGGSGSLGSWLPYGIRYENRGSADALNVVITDTLPDSTAFESWTGYTYKPDYTDLKKAITPIVTKRQVAWHLGNVAAGEYGYVYLSVRLDDSVRVGFVVTNTVAIATDSAETDYANNSKLAVQTITAPKVDMSVYKTLPSGRPAPGGELGYSIRFNNYGELAATDVVLTDSLPLSSTLVSWSGYMYNPQWTELPGTITPTIVDGKVIWHLGTIKPGKYGYIYPRIRLDNDLAVGSTVTNAVEVSTRDVEYYYWNNVSVDSRPAITPTVDMSLSKSLLSPKVAAGDVVTFEIRYLNRGEKAAHDVVITDTLPLSASYVSWSGLAYNPERIDLERVVMPTASNGQVRWYLGTVAASGYGSIYPSVRLDRNVPVGTSITNAAEVATSDPESLYSNNTAMSVRPVVSPTVDMYLSKSSTSASTAPGSSLYYQLYYQNRGSATAHDVVVTDTLPVSTSLSSWSGYAYNPDYVDLDQAISATVAAGQIRWHLGTVVASGYGYIQPKVLLDSRLKPQAIVTNTAEVGTGDVETSYANNAGINVRTVNTPTVDVFVNKWLVSGQAVAGNLLSYEIYFGNNGSGEAREVILTDTLPVSSSHVSWSGSLYNPDRAEMGQIITPTIANGKINWYLGTLTASSYGGRRSGYGFISTTIRLDANVPAGSTVPNRALISTRDAESQTSNNTSVDVRVVQDAIPTASATPTPSPTGTPGAQATPTFTPTGTPTSLATATPTLTGTSSPTPSATPTATATGSPPAAGDAALAGRVGLQARGNPPRASWIVPLTVTLSSSEGPGVETLAYRFNPSTDTLGRFTLAGIAPGAYNIKVKKARSLTNSRANVALVAGDNALDLGILLEGDANDDAAINSLDYGFLAGAYFRSRAEPGFEERADFNDDGRVDALDFAPLASNYFKRSE